MSYKETDIKYETATHWVLDTKLGFEVYKKGITHSESVASFAHGLCNNGLEKAISSCDYHTSYSERSEQ